MVERNLFADQLRSEQILCNYGRELKERIPLPPLTIESSALPQSSNIQSVINLTEVADIPTEIEQIRAYIRNATRRTSEQKRKGSFHPKPSLR